MIVILRPSYGYSAFIFQFLSAKVIKMFQKHLFLAEELTNFVLESLFFDVEQMFHVENLTSQAFKLPFSSL